MPRSSTGPPALASPQTFFHSFCPLLALGLHPCFSISEIFLPDTCLARALSFSVSLERRSVASLSKVTTMLPFVLGSPGHPVFIAHVSTMDGLPDYCLPYTVTRLLFGMKVAALVCALFPPPLKSVSGTHCALNIDLT